MTPIKLPRPRKGKLPFKEALMLEQLGILDRSPDAIAELKREILSASLPIPPTEIDETLSSLVSRGRILLGSKHFAISSRLSTKLKQERDRNRQRTLYRRARAGTLEEDWSAHQRTLKTFPALRGPIERPESYNRPAAFEKLLAEFPSYHKSDCPANVEIITEACYPGELQSVLTYIAEQQSANRAVALLFTRKALYVGVIRAPKR